MRLLLIVTLLVPNAALAQRSRAGSSISSDAIFRSIGVREGATVCEIGAGDGTLTIAAARLVGPEGRVYANELGDARLEALRGKTAGSGLANISVTTGQADATGFPDGVCDGLFMRDVYHHLTDPAAVGRAVMAALKPGGRFAVVDFTPPGEEAACPADRSKDGMHGVKPATVTREMEEAGFEPVQAEVPDARWFLLVFKRSS